jgi:hypothetical protein
MFTWAQVMVEEERYRDKVRKAEQKRQNQRPANTVEVRADQESQARPTPKSTTSPAAV